MQLLDPAFWFYVRPPVMSFWGMGIGTVVLVAMFVAGVALMRRSRQMEKHRLRGYQKFASWFITWAVLGLAWLFFTYEQINFFGARFWALAGFLSALVWFVFIIRYWKKVMPALELLRSERAEFEKYLPKKKQ